MRKFIFGTLTIIVILFFFYIFKESLYFSPDNWETQINDIGSASSPRAVDLTGDGILDIVMGGGAREFAPTNYGVFALDGDTGEILWNVASRNQVIGSPSFLDINDDDTPDVLIGGRTAILFALDGKTGEVIWEYMPSYVGMDIINDRSILNFYNIQLIPDQDGDGLQDLLTAYGGFIKAQPTDPDRPVGSLIVVSSKDGSTLAKVEVPDGRETYISPVVHDFEGNGELSVLFGTGGETMNGHFYKVPLQSVLNEDLTDAVVLAEGRGKGFIGPPVLTNINDDNVKDVVVNSVNGKVFCIDGDTNQIIWETNLGEEFEGYTSPAPGHFNSDEIPDFFVSYGHGVWPAIDFAYQVMLDGSDGSIISADTAGTFQYASPVSFDFTQDGIDEALIVTNTKAEEETGMTTLEIYVNELLAFDPANGTQFRIHERKAGSNLGSTPLLTDLDDDGYLDIIYSYMNDPMNYYSFKSLRIERIEMNREVNRIVKWGEYMGPENNGLYRN